MKVNKDVEAVISVLPQGIYFGVEEHKNSYKYSRGNAFTVTPPSTHTI